MVNRTIFMVSFSVAISVCIPLFLYIARRNPNPRFRPRPGELLLLAIVMIGGSAGVSILFSSLFGVDDIVRGIDAGPPSSSSSQPSLLDGESPGQKLFE